MSKKASLKNKLEELERVIKQMEDSELELMVAGTNDGVLMVESEATELSEKVMLGAVTFGHEAFQQVIRAIIELAEVAAKEPWDLAPPEDNSEIKKKVADLIGDDIAAAYFADQVAVVDYGIVAHSRQAYRTY